MKTTPLETDSPDVRLVEPELERDAQLGVQWLHGDAGRKTLQLMGVSDKDNKATTLEQEKQRVTEFIENPSQLNWMIEHNNRVVGSIWVDLESKGNLANPSIHIMIGDPSMRGKGVGFSAMSRVVEHLEDIGNKSIYSRHLTMNGGVKSLLSALGFKDKGKPYADEDGLEWQNVKR